MSDNPNLDWIPILTVPGFVSVRIGSAVYDVSKWLPILIWSGCVGIQIGTAARRWKRWRNRQRMQSRIERKNDLDRVVDGEIHHGWQMAVPRRLIRLQKRMKYAVPISPLLDSSELAESSILIQTSAQLGNQGVTQIHRYSLISPTINSTLFKITFNVDEWKLQDNRSQYRSQYLSRREVAVILQNRNNETVYRFVLVDTRRRGMSQMFDVEAPDPQFDLQYAFWKDRPKPRLVLWFVQETESDNDDDDENGSKRFEWHTVSYEIPTAAHQRQNPIRASSWETVSIPVGAWDRLGNFVIDDEKIISIIARWKNPLDYLEGQRCVTFDGEIWKIASLRNWLQSLEQTPSGARMLDVFRSLDDLWGSTKRWTSHDSYTPGSVSHLPHLVRPHPRTIFYDCTDGLLRRWCRPPSLKFLAAEAVFRAKSNLSRDRLKSVVGFDIFEEIPDETKDDETMVIYA